MKRGWPIAAIFLFLTTFCATDIFAQAQGLINVQEKAYAAQIEPVTLDVLTTLDVASATTNGRVTEAWAIEVYNTSTSTSAVCAFRSDVTASPDSTTAGRPVPAGTGVLWAVRNVSETLFCISSSGLLRLIISQFR